MIVEVYNRVMELGKAGTSGMQNEDEFNSKVDSVQKALEEILIDIDDENQKATDALAWLKSQSGPLSSDSLGRITMPTDYLHLDTVTYISGGNRWPATKLETNEVDMTRTSPIRAPNLATNDINYYFKKGTMYVMPEQANIVVDFLYYKLVPAATIVLTPSSTGNEDLLVPSTGIDFGWPQSMFNMLVYLILEQYGVEVHEQLLVEYSQLGITREMIKTNPQ